jgi:hypothetical protein
LDVNSALFLSITENLGLEQEDPQMEYFINKHKANFRKLIFLTLTILLMIGYFIFLVRIIQLRGLFEYVGIDFRLWYSTGMIARYHGFNQIYLASYQSFYQKPLYDNFARISPSSMSFWPLPLPYLPFFIIPMLFLTLFSPLTGFILWTIVNISMTILYLIFFIRNNNIKLCKRYYLLMLLSIPLFLNIIFGQLNIILLISIGESITAMRKGKELKSGIWLSGLLLKPQTLILFVIGFIILKKIKVLSGLGIGSVIILFVSYMVAGKTSITGPLSVIKNWPTILGDSGMNFLSLLSFLNESQNNSPFLTILLVLCAIALLAIIIWLWLPKNHPLDLGNISKIYLATYAATCCLSPHSNVHMAIPIIPLAMLTSNDDQNINKFTIAWVLVPGYLFLSISLFSVGFAHVLVGMIILIMNTGITIFVFTQQFHTIGKSNYLQ